MNPSADTGTSPAGAGPRVKPPGRDAIPTNWREALMALIASRISLIQLESKDVARFTIRSAALILAACVCGFFSWALLLAGGISLTARLAGWHWAYVAMGAAAIHLLAGLLMARIVMKSPKGAAFPVTRAEFQKDREWIENFQKTPRSND